MKKYIFGLIALIIAINTAIFAQKNRNSVDVYYIFDNSEGYTLTELKEFDNWQSSTSSSCGGSTEICKIKLQNTDDLQTFLNNINQISDFTSVVHSSRN